ncbi:sulfur carrier protein [Micromonospora phaseoli]|uniref:Sulfur carrier protein n=1 Tax=Micromonospora phaseoli TaxID=1144548 RepID=A0A1H6X2Q9_9ACTN|nr:sulfur carrier protein ThiS [Micromonospora phaseoli]PZW02063.1 sulfur carrier protein ThiS [Micromonospora phaseoli]GIJ80470.1 thiamine biosynthesis protein ThiS [Micromonospora phaseoli]SEJ23389.1 sulfur carrier protein [Micromonospora phaseoli]
MELTVNGVERSVRDGVTVAELVRDVSGQERGVAVAVNGEVVPRTGWPATALCGGDQVEVLSAAQGG